MRSSWRGRAALVAALVCCGPTPAFAQRTSDDSEYVVTQWQTEDGLPENSATAIVQTADGYLWFGTFKGLVRFDGVRLTVLDTTNTPELPSEAIINLHLDRSGRLWVSTMRGAAFLRDGRWHAVGPDGGWVGDYARWFVEAADGRLYVATFDGRIMSVVGDRFRELPDPRPGNHDAFFPYLDSQQRLCILQSGYAAAWQGDGWEPRQLPAPLVLGGEHGWLQARDGALVHVGGRTLRRLRGSKVVAERRLTESVGGFWSLTEDSRGFLWLASYNRGIYRIAPDGGTRRFSLASGFPVDSARCVFEDRQRNIWIGTGGGGLVRLRPRRFASYGPAQGLPPTGFKSVAISKDQVVHVAAYGEGLLELRGGVVRRPRVHQAFAYPQAVLVDRAGRVWVGTYRSGLYLSQSGRWTQLLGVPRTVTALFEDSSGQVWAATPGVALVWRDPREPPREVRLATPRTELRCFAEDAANRVLWAGGADGVYRLGPRGLELVDPPPQTRAFGVGSLHVDDRGLLWAGSLIRGLWMRAADRWVDIGGRSGLPPLSVTGLCRHSGYLWVATNRGIWRARLDQLVAAASAPMSEVVWQSFGMADGLPSVDCSSTTEPSIARDGQGRLWFCTLKGLASVDPSRLELAGGDIPLHVERLEYADAAGRIHGLDRPADEIVIPAGARDLRLSFTAIDLAAPEKVRFSSRLEQGELTVASTLSDRREITVPALAAGSYRFTLRARDGDSVWSNRTAELRFSIRPYFWQTLWFRLAALLVAAAAVAGVTRRLTLARSRRAHQLSKLQSRLALVLQNTNDAVTFTAPDERLTYMNEAAARLLGFPDTRVDALSAVDLYPPWAHELLTSQGMNAVRRTGSWQGMSALRHREGHEIPVWQQLVALRDPKGAIELVASIARDMTDVTRMEEQVRQAQKMESVGLLAGGVAHDFNNLLQVILAYVELARRPGLDPVRQKHLEHVVEAAERAARLTRQLLAFGRRQPLKLEVTDIAELVGQHLRMVRRVIGEHITIEFAAHPDLGLVRCDRTQVEQVVLNLCVNARDAMPKGGRLRLVLAGLTADEAYVDANPWARPGRYLVLSVTDTGCGMDKRTCERIFEPFFTTKAAGTGLGLSVVYGIVRQHGGMIRVYSEVGAGTTFKVYFPRVEQDAKEATSSAESAPPCGTETILVAEDDREVAAATRSILEGAGYKVALAESGVEAVRLFEERPEAYDLLLFDCIMPGMGGREAREVIRRRRPTVPVLFCSGYDPPSGRTSGQEDPVIEKPYSPAALLRRVREVLDQAPLGVPDATGGPGGGI